MITSIKSKPVVMSLSGHDPSGGAGIQADIEAIRAQNCHATTVITCFTVQDTCNVYRIDPAPATGILQQATRVLEDMPVHAFKIGLIGSLKNIENIARILQEHPDIPVVLDPVLASGGGKSLSSKELATAICKKLLPLTTILTPNIPEARALSQCESVADCALYFADQGCRYTLITGTHSTRPTRKVINTLLQNGNIVSELSWPRLPFTYHGSGCTLASSIAAKVATGQTVIQAVEQAQEYTWTCLHKATRQGKGQLIPSR